MNKQDNKDLKHRSIYKNLLIFYVGTICLISGIYMFYFWNGSLYNALVLEQNRGLREWFFIIPSIGVFPFIFLAFIRYVKMVWDGSLFTEQFSLRNKK